MRAALLPLCLFLIPPAFAQDTGSDEAQLETDADDPADDTQAPALEAAAPEVSTEIDTSVTRGAGEQLVLNTPEVDVSTVQSVTDDATRATYTTVSGALEDGIRQAQQALTSINTRISNTRAEIKVASTNLATRKLNLKAAQKELKAIKLAQDSAREREAMRLIDEAKVALNRATQTLKVKKLELSWALAYKAHVTSLLDQERTRLEEAKLRAANPATEVKDVLKAAASSSKAEGKEAKARGKLADALAKLRAARAALENIR